MRATRSQQRVRARTSDAAGPIATRPGRAGRRRMPGSQALPLLAQAAKLRRAGAHADARAARDLQLARARWRSSRCSSRSSSRRSIRGAVRGLARDATTRAASQLAAQPDAAPRSQVHAGRQRPAQGQRGCASSPESTSRYPLLDDELVEFSGRIAAGARRCRRLKLRYFFKEALRGLPAARDHRQDKARLRTALRRLAGERIPPLRSSRRDEPARARADAAILRAEPTSTAERPSHERARVLLRRDAVGADDARAMAAGPPARTGSPAESGDDLRLHSSAASTVFEDHDRGYERVVVVEVGHAEERAGDEVADKC